MEDDSCYCSCQGLRIQDSKSSGIGIEIYGNGANGIACPWICFARDDCFTGNTNCRGSVALDGCLGLWPAHLDEGLMEGYHCFGTDEETC